LIFGLIVCAIIAGVVLRWFFLTTSDGPQETGQSSGSIKPQAPTVELTPEEETAALKKEEMGLARHVMNEFPQSGGSYMLMGDLCARHGNSTDAVTFWQKSLEMDPKNFDACRNMGRIALEKEQFDQAVQLLRKALEIKPNAADLRSDIAKALMDSETPRTCAVISPKPLWTRASMPKPLRNCKTRSGFTRHPSPLVFSSQKHIGSRRNMIRP
jgi:Tfp pilus assembly protein PilF